MRRPHRLLGALQLILVTASCKPAPAELEALAVSALQSEIPALQEQFLAAHGVYAGHIRDLTGGADTLLSGIRVILRGGTAQGWAASSSHPEVPGAACAVYVGEPSIRINLMGGVAPREPGMVSCIAFEPWKQQGIIERSGPFALRSNASPQ
ncbi:MAG: hypothetical protein H0X65_21175 [Gemmatimonadetes bacterium]|nr:hypothetical protein [Gemmatimonadota bacterium]